MIDTLICCGILYVLSFCFDESQEDMCNHMWLVTVASPMLYITFTLCYDIYDGWKWDRMEKIKQQIKIKHEKYFSSKIDKELENDNC